MQTFLITFCAFIMGIPKRPIIIIRKIIGKILIEMVTNTVYGFSTFQTILVTI